MVMLLYTSGKPWTNSMSGLEVSPAQTQWNFIPLAVTYSWEPKLASCRQAGGTGDIDHVTIQSTACVVWSNPQKSGRDQVKL
jgi:hypothetical protein